MRWFLLIGLFCLLLAMPLAAQDATPMVPVTDENLTEMGVVATQIAENVTEYAGLVEEADSKVDHAFNLLGLFELVFGLITFVGTVGAITAGIVGFRGIQQINSAREELIESKKKLEKETSELRESFDKQIALRLKELEETLRFDNAKTLSATAFIPIGERQYRASDYEGAINTYSQALELDANHLVVNQKLAYVYTQKGEIEKAKYHYEKTLQQQANFAPALAGLGFVHRRMAEHVEKEMKSLHNNKPMYDQKEEQRKEILNKAESLLLQALRISPRLVDDDGESWWGVLGGLYKRREQINEAIDAYKRVTEITPNSSYGFGNLALLYMRKNDIEQMLQTYVHVERIAEKEAVAEQGNFWGYADLITSRFALGKAEKAEEVLPTALSLAPAESPYMLQGLAETLADLAKVLPQNTPAIQRAIQRIYDHLKRNGDSAASTQ